MISSDFWASYISGVAGLLIGNPLDLIKVRLQAGGNSSSPTGTLPSQYGRYASLLRGSWFFLLYRIEHI